MGILALVIGLWYYDFSVAGPGSESKYDEIEKMAATKNAMGVKEGGTVTSADVSQVVGFPPTYVEQGEYHTTEWYCWWGKIPGLATWKRYITVVYVGEPRRFSSHYKNEAPPLEAIPGAEKDDPAATTGGEVMAPPTEITAPSRLGGGEASKASGGETEGATATDDAKKGETKAGDKPAEDKPAEDKPAENKASEDKPAEVKPAEEKPADAKPAENKPAGDKPASGDSSETKPQ
jgi:hypothetical protein